MIMHFQKGWQILQDVNDAGEILEFYKPGFIGQEHANQVSEWEDLPELKHLQLKGRAQNGKGNEQDRRSRQKAAAEGRFHPYSTSNL